MMKAKLHHAGARALRLGSKVERKDYYFVLTTTSLSWYKTSKEDDLKGAFNITPDVQCKVSSDTGRGVTQFSFRKSAGG
jgi:hypothetical protein